MQTKFVAAAAATVVAFGLAIGVVEAAPGMGASAARGPEAAPIERVTYAWDRGCSHFRSHRHRYGWHRDCHWRHRHCYWGQRCWGGYPSWGYPRRWGQDHDGQHRAWA
jgi:hypothetical protein